MSVLQANGYQVYFQDAAYQALNEQLAEQAYSGIYILVDEGSHEHCLPSFLAQVATEIPIEIIEFESGEQHKNLYTCLEVWQALTELGADRKSLIVNLGGGVVTDLGGFVASAYKRGIDFINVPTTLLAMVDASIGGKNGVDLGALKNQIGVINAPKMVLIDVAFLETLPQNEMRSGLAEMLKHGLIYDRAYWNEFLDLGSMNWTELERLIQRSIEIKNDIVLQDPTENGIRKALNFGHTIGHAIESYFLDQPEKPNLLHGEAIAAGMIIESFMAWRKNLISQTELNEIKAVISDIFETLSIQPDDVSPIMDLLIHDKKNEYGQVQFALIEGIGKIIINQTAEKEEIKEAFAYYRT
ncbi:3-dehydroquinate synthase [Flavobacterium sp. CYK-55]|uniref:3-dehydroquinate synthase n=1 Tax=Flavobacterium sp. CYK-55 TaxID=2835529 RepID=UPI001BD165AC|nr:3-dehydroquinate synthase [Flavobacterium sp. CYK-55]MBS7786641.1 3-dehydroquinate synthase [Flavobacterium sp. CYK-55]